MVMVMIVSQCGGAADNVHADDGDIVILISGVTNKKIKKQYDI